MELKVYECDCEGCVTSCINEQGTFGPIKQLRDSAEILNMKVVEFIKEYCVGQKIYLLDKNKQTRIIIPVANRVDWTNEKFSNSCMFLDRNKSCIIHEAKPLICKAYSCSFSKHIRTETWFGGYSHRKNPKGLDKSNKLWTLHDYYIQYWQRHQNFIERMVSLGALKLEEFKFF